jgi:hypothetical protein
MASKEHCVKRGVLTVVMSFLLGLSGVAAASVLTSGTPSPASTRASVHPHPMKDAKESDADKKDAENDTAENDTQDAGVHGGPSERSHDAGQCSLTDVASLPGNWTHGDYVSAVAQGDDPAQVPQAAHSDCGKPTAAGGQGGPSEQAKAHMKAGQAHAHGGEGGKPGDSGS